MNILKIDNENRKKEIALEILHSLPNWFEFEDSILEYAENSRKMLFLAAYENDIPIGFLSIKRTSTYCSEVYVMGILESFHRHGIGRILVQEAEDYCKEQGIEYMQVKTLDSSNADTSYAKTRAFYEGIGFRPMECIVQIWGDENPCLIMVKSLL